jgi:dUTP pyrophosphatase
MSAASNDRQLRVHMLRPGLAALPRYATEGAAGLDLTAALEQPMVIEPGARALVPTGLAIELPARCEGQVRPRSGLAAKHGVTVLNAPGTIDEDYRGEVQVLLINLGREAHVIQPGDRIAQLVVAPVTQVEVVQVHEAAALAASTRGQGGFGSTGR